MQNTTLEAAVHFIWSPDSANCTNPRRVLFHVSWSSI